MLRCALISLGSESSKSTVQALTKYFDEVDDLNIHEIEGSIVNNKLVINYKNEPLMKHYDGMYVKGSFRYAALLRAITEAYGKETYMPINPEAFTICHDKILTHLVLQRYGIPMPKTYLFPTPEAAKDFLKNKATYPLIFKIPQGTQGKGVIYADGYASASSILDTLTTLKQPFLVQEYIDSEGVDYRVFVIGKNVLAYKRVAQKGEERSNIHAGGHGEKVIINEEIKKVALKTAKAVGADICGVDILPSRNGPLVIEVNISPGLKGITEATGMDVADNIAKYIYKKAQKQKHGQLHHQTKSLMQELDIENITQSHDIITKLDFRGERVLLPKYITKAVGLNDEKEYVIQIKDNDIVIKKQ